MGALIILGAVLLLIVRYILHRRQRSEEDDEDLAASIDKLKKELQQSADTIIKRLGSHVTKLEGLLREADDRRVRLETRVADAQRLEWALRQRIEELERRLSDLGQIQAVPVVHPAESHAAHMAEIPPQVQETRRTDGDEFAAVLHQSILREQARASDVTPQPVYAAPCPTPISAPMPRAVVQEHVQASMPHMPPQEMPHIQYPSTPPPILPTEEPAVIEETADVQEDEALIKARALLRAGRSIEQVARETGVEIGALRLMKQMTQRD